VNKENKKEVNIKHEHFCIFSDKITQMCNRQVDNKVRRGGGQDTAVRRAMSGQLGLLLLKTLSPK
jgi:hypothetical protein